jgi:hypothetical protein
LIKGTFKDHLVTWVGQYLVAENGKTRVKEILDDIDQRFANFICMYSMDRSLIFTSALLWFLYLLIYGDFLKGGTSNNGLATIPRP